MSHRCPENIFQLLEAKLQKNSPFKAYTLLCLTYSGLRVVVLVVVGSLVVVGIGHL